ncbi:hypothetical protein FRC08_016427 [Ceratobasidium sp. 394]|nr:hypothetical protein FRC08_016427 [Ceratobasidium sp. 394]KAG9100719.1 hypothetical protein FS749_013408 [Ceratobasidium sp. UAMH 11750]
MTSPIPSQCPKPRMQTLPEWDIKSRAVNIGWSLRRVKSEIHPKGRVGRRIFAAKGSEPGIGDALASSVARVAGAPLMGSLYAPAALAAPEAGVAPVNNTRASPRWISILTPPSPTDDEPVSHLEDAPRVVAELDRHEITSNTPPVLPASGNGSYSSARVKRRPSPLVVPQWTEHSHITAFNPDHTQIIEPGTTPSSSPTAITPGAEICRRRTPNDVREPPNLESITVAISSLDALVSSLHPTSRQPTQSTIESYKTAEQWCERKMLIIGSSYTDDNGQTNARLSSASTWDPLTAIEHDVNDLESTFKARGYDVETMTRGDFDRARVLDEVARFLVPALPGDVRVIVFTGHSIRLDTGSPAMVLPGTPSDVTIPAREWNQNIRAHTKPGVIVLSILSTCFAGGFAEQDVRITDFTLPQEVENVGSFNAPILVTFSSCGSQERSYESPLGDYELQERDHFLWALARTARAPDVHTWQQFVARLKDSFAFARSIGSLGAPEGPLKWMWDNPQNPVLTATFPLHLPALKILLPVTPNEGLARG